MGWKFSSPGKSQGSRSPRAEDQGGGKRMQKLEMGFHAGKFQDGTAKGRWVVGPLTKANKTGAVPEGGALAKLTQISVNVFPPYYDLSGLRRSDLGKTPHFPERPENDLPRFFEYVQGRAL